MRKPLLLIMSLIYFFQYANSQQYGSLKDSRDGRIYKTVKIGSQVWMAENLNTDKFINGDLIPEAKTEAEWNKAVINKKPTWCYYGNNSSNAKIYGKLYNYWAMIDPRGLAPNRFHIPSKDEWDSLKHEIFINPNFESRSEGGGGAVGLYLKSSQHWQPPPPPKYGNPFGFNIGGTGNNKSGFTAQPGGSRGSNGKFLDLEKSGEWWTSTKGIYRNIWTENNEEGYYTAILNHYDDDLKIWPFGLMAGHSVRCVREIDSAERAEIAIELKKLREQDTLNQIALYKRLLDEPINLDNYKVAEDNLPQKMTWHEAMNWSKKMGNGWRLPRVKELRMFLKSDISKNMRNNYWSSTVSKSNPDSVIVASSKLKSGLNQELNWDFISAMKDESYSVRLIWSQLSNEQLDSLDNIEDSLKLVREENLKAEYFNNLKLRLNNESIEIKNLNVSKFDLPTQMTYEQAVSFCKMLNDNWRLPNKKELSIIYGNRYKIGGFDKANGETIYLTQSYLGVENGVILSLQFKNYGEIVMHGGRIDLTSSKFWVRLVKSQ